MASPYGPPASDVFHKYLNNQSLVPNQGLDSADPDSIPLLLLLQLWSGGGGCEGTSPSGIGTRHAVAFSGRGGGGSRRASCCGTGAQPERGTLREPGASLPNVIHWGWRGAPAPSNPRPGGTPPAPPSPPPLPSPSPGNFEPGSHPGLHGAKSRCWACRGQTIPRAR